MVGFGFCLFLLFQVDVMENPHVDDEIKSNYGTPLDTFLILFGALNGVRFCLCSVWLYLSTFRFLARQEVDGGLGNPQTELGLQRAQRLQVLGPLHLRLRPFLHPKYHRAPQPPHCSSH